MEEDSLASTAVVLAGPNFKTLDLYIPGTYTISYMIYIKHESNLLLLLLRAYLVPDTTERCQETGDSTSAP